MKDQFFNRRGSKITPALLATLLWLFSGNVFADGCNFISNNTVILPSSSSTIINDKTVDVAGITPMSCINAGTYIPPIYTLKAQITSMMTLKNTKNGDYISYSIYRNPIFDLPLGSGNTLDYSNDPNLLKSSGGITANTPIYIRTKPGTNISAGTYTDNISLAWNYNICGQIVLGGICLRPMVGTATTSITVSLVVTTNCLINSAPEVIFGSAALVGQFNPITQNVVFTCTKGTPFNTFVAYQNNPDKGWQQMKSSSSGGTTDFLQYNIYQGSGTTVWNEASKLSGTGTGLSQTLSYNAVINPNQPQKTPGNYQDNVVLMVEY